MVKVDLVRFWELMCDPRFVRLTDLTGRIGSTVYWTPYAPERVDGFVERVVDGIRRDLG